MASSSRQGSPHQGRRRVPATSSAPARAAPHRARQPCLELVQQMVDAKAAFRRTGNLASMPSSCPCGRVANAVQFRGRLFTRPRSRRCRDPLPGWAIRLASRALHRLGRAFSAAAARSASGAAARVKIALWILKPSSPTRSVHAHRLRGLGCGQFDCCELAILHAAGVRSHSSTVPSPPPVARTRSSGENVPGAAEASFLMTGKRAAPCRVLTSLTVAPSRLDLRRVVVGGGRSFRPSGEKAMASSPPFPVLSGCGGARRSPDATATRSHPARR